jgi:predicted AAA+ superfamily ATPase
LDRALRAVPVVVITGARQTGKSTLVAELHREDRRGYVTLDDLDALQEARDAPEGGG